MAKRRLKRKLTKAEKNLLSPSEELFGSQKDLTKQKARKLEEKPIKSLREIEEEERIPSKSVSKSDFKQSAAAEDPFFQQDVTVEEGLGRLLGTITDPKNIEHFSEFDDQEVVALSACEAIAAKIDSPTLEKFLKEFKSHRVSTSRRGRTEIVEIARAMMGAAEAKAQGVLNSVRSVFGR